MRACLVAFVLVAATGLLGGCPGSHPDLALGRPGPDHTQFHPLSPVVGETLAAAEQHDFFTFFHWTEASRAPAAASRTEVTFKPPAESMFPEEVVLHVVVAADDTILALTLQVARRFIDGDQGIFARDVVKSFLRAGVPGADAPAIDGLASEIERRGLDPNADVPADPSAGFLVYAGQADTWTQDLGGARLVLTSSPEWFEASFGEP